MLAPYTFTLTNADPDLVLGLLNPGGSGGFTTLDFYVYENTSATPLYSGQFITTTGAVQNLADDVIDLDLTGGATSITLDLSENSSGLGDSFGLDYELGELGELAIPEPSTYALVALGLGGLLVARKLRGRRSA